MTGILHRIFLAGSADSTLPPPTIIRVDVRFKFESYRFWASVGGVFLVMDRGSVVLHWRFFLMDDPCLYPPGPPTAWSSFNPLPPSPRISPLFPQWYRRVESKWMHSTRHTEVLVSYIFYSYGSKLGLCISLCHFCLVILYFGLFYLFCSQPINYKLKKI